jgi:curved DNA-binding protein CbpA
MTASDDSPTADIPFYLMPIAAILGSYALFGSIRAVYLIYANLTFSDMKDASSTTKKPPSVRLNSSGMLLLVATVIFSMVGYAKIVAQVNYAILETEYALFDPYDILGISSEANSTIVKQAYRTLSKQHHPDKGGEEKIFHRVNLAYRALTTDFDNFQKYGHPDGPLTTQSLAFALPEWLLRPQGSVAVVLVLLYLGMFVMVGYYVVSWLKASSESSSNSNDMSVSGDDTMYMVQHLSPDSSHWDVLLCIATAPESISISTKAINKIEEMKREKLSKLAASSKKVPTDVFDLDGGGWDDDDHDAAKKEAEELQKQQEQIKAATGATDVVLEGVDQGVLGQKWVENTLEKFGQWPPLDLGFLEGKTFDWKGRKVGALDHPAIRRNLCFTMGRLNSIVLNTHTELRKCRCIF